MGRDFISELNPVWFKTLDHGEHKEFFKTAPQRLTLKALRLPIQNQSIAMMYDIEILSKS